LHAAKHHKGKNTYPCPRLGSKKIAQRVRLNLCCKIAYCEAP
jgi:hypothetical protein